MKKILLLLLGVLIIPLFMLGDTKAKEKEGNTSSTTQVESTKTGEPPALSTPPVISEQKDITIQVAGRGGTKENALQDAFRNAIEKVFGVYVYSKTTVEKSVLTEDKIIAMSKGFVKDYKIEFENQSGGIYFLTVNVTISASKFNTFIRDNKVSLWRDIIKDVTLIQSTQERLKKYAEILTSMVGDPNYVLKNGYSIDVVGYTVDDTGVDYVKGNFLLQIAINQEFWNSYMDIIKQMTYDGNTNCAEEGLMGGIRFDVKMKEMTNYRGNIFSGEHDYGYIDTVRVHRSLKKFFAKPINTEIEIDGYKKNDIILFKNSIIVSKWGYRADNFLRTNYECYNFEWLKKSANLVPLFKPNLEDEWVKSHSDIYKLSDNYLAFGDLPNSNYASMYLIPEYVVLKVPFKLKDEKELKNLSFKYKITVTGAKFVTGTKLMNVGSHDDVTEDDV